MTRMQVQPVTSQDYPALGMCHYVYSKAAVPLASGNWVSLLDPPSEYAHDEALLLCQLSEDDWLTWIPSFGEIALCLRQFCPLPG